MIKRLTELSLQHRGFMAALAATLVLGGWWAVSTMPVDAIPDLSDAQVIVFTDYAGQAPQVVEDQVTYPLSTAMLSVPFATSVRGYSFFGFSMIYIIFEDGTDLYWARSRVLEYLNYAQRRLPEGTTPQLGPDATGVGWVYEYTLSDFSRRAQVLRDNLDRDGSGLLEDAELPVPAELSLVGGSELAAYSEEQLLGFFATDSPAATRTAEEFADDSLGYLVDGFDSDGDRRISRDELARAAAFMGHDLARLRSIQDWYLRYDLMSQKGVAEVASVGGFVRQYQVEVDPEKLRAFGVTIPAVRRAIQRANLDVGGRLIEMAETEFMVRGQGYIRSIDDLATIPVKIVDGAHTPVLLRQVARVQLGPAPRRGLVDMNGEGEVVTGIVLLRFGGNALEVIDRVKQRLEELKGGLPEGVEIHTSYDRSLLVKRAISTLTGKLAQEMVVVALVCLLFLGHLRSSLVALIALPLGVLASLLIMRLLGQNANIMSLGGIAIAIGVMVDASVVMVDNVHRYHEHNPGRDHMEIVREAALEVGPALFYSLLIVTVSFLPVFALEQQEGRLFMPLAATKTFAMAASAVLAITMVPALAYWFARPPAGRSAGDNLVSRTLTNALRPAIEFSVRRPRAVVAAAALVALSSLVPLSMLGSEFMPPLNEGDLLYMPTTPPGISITKARELLQQTDRIIATHPQVAHVLGKVGRAATATDPAPLSMIETTIMLRPREQWPRGKTLEDVVAELDSWLQFPGVTNAWTMPIKTRIDMLATGIRTPVGVKLLGDDLDVLNRVGERLEAVLQEVPGTASVYAERVVGGNYIDVRVRREEAARYGLNVADVQEIVSSAIGGMNVTETVEGLERYPVNLRFPRELRGDLETLARVAVPTPMGHTVPLAQVADLSVTKGPPAIKSENARLTAWVFVDLDTSDVGGYVEHAREVVAERLRLPAGVTLVWSGQYEYMQRASERLRMVVPLTLAAIFVLLYLHFRRLGPGLLVMLGTVAVAPAGGLWLLWLLGYNTSIAVWVGFIALAGLAAETGVVMLVYIEQAVARHLAAGGGPRGDSGDGGLAAAVSAGVLERVRPVLMTTGTTFIGLLPVMFGSGAGTQVLQRIAAPMVGGLVTSTSLTLFVLPALYLLWQRWEKGSRSARKPGVAGGRWMESG